MTYEPKGKQVDIITSTAPVLVGLGGAGTGKTTTAVAAARAHGFPPPQSVLGAASNRVPGAPPGFTYDQLIPAARRLLAIPKIAEHYRNRYGIVICDEFQDTDNSSGPSYS